MKLTQLAVSAVLIPVLVAAPVVPADRSVQELLKHPEFGITTIYQSDGSFRQGTPVRITTQFVVLRDDTDCSTIDLKQIASVHLQGSADPYKVPSPRRNLSLTGDGELDFGLLGDTLIVAIFLAFEATEKIKALHFGPRWHGNKSALHLEDLVGEYRPEHPLPDGTIRRLSFHHQSVVQEDWAVRKGRYSLKGQTLKLTYEDGKGREQEQVRFHCNEISLEGNHPPLTMSTFQKPQAKVYAPMVGVWSTQRDAERWIFRANGTFAKRTLQPTRTGIISGKGDKALVHWTGPVNEPDETWTAHLDGNALVIKTGKAETKYKSETSARADPEAF